MTTTRPRSDRTADRVLLFDMDGVVLEGRETDPSVHSRALDDALTSFGLDPTAEHRRALDTYEYTDAFEAACRDLEVDPSALFRTRERYSVERSIARLRSDARTPYPDVDVLDRLATTHDLGLVSNNYHRTAQFVVDRHDLDAFSVVRGRDPGVEGFRRRKPDPYYLERALDALGASDGVYVGDRESDLIAADRAGLDPVLIRREYNAGLEPSVEPVATVDGLDELRSLPTVSGQE